VPAIIMTTKPYVPVISPHFSRLLVWGRSAMALVVVWNEVATTTDPPHQGHRYDTV
jgi:hypothetical protein